MGQPTTYSRGYSFTDWSTANPTLPVSGVNLDVEFEALELTISEILTNLALIQRDDGELANESVGLDQLDGTELDAAAAAQAAEDAAASAAAAAADAALLAAAIAIATGPAGADGRTVLNGSGAATGGSNGDFYIRTSNWTISGPKAAGVWPTAVSLLGAAGTNGTDGVDGAAGNRIRVGAGAPSGGTGANGDLYIDTATGNLYGPKSVGAWGSGVTLHPSVAAVEADVAALETDVTALQATAAGLGTMSTQAASAVAVTGGTIAGITDLAVADGGTGASTGAAARINLGVGSALVSTTTFSASGGPSVALDTTNRHNIVRFAGLEPSASGANFTCQLSYDGGATWLASTNYAYAWISYNSIGYGQGASNGAAAVAVAGSVSNTADLGNFIEIEVVGPKDTNQGVEIVFKAGFLDSSSHYTTVMGSAQVAAQASPAHFPTHIRIVPSSGTVSGAVVTRSYAGTNWS